MRGFDFNKPVKLKPFYSVTIREDRIMIFFPPFEFYEVKDNTHKDTDLKKLVLVRRDSIYIEFIKKLMSDCVNVEVFIEERNLSKREAKVIKEFSQDLWESNMVMTCYNDEFTDERKEWVYFLSKFTNEPQDVLKMVLSTDILFILPREFTNTFEEYLNNELKIFSNIKISTVDYRDGIGNVLEKSFKEYDYIVSIVNGFRPSFILKLNKLTINYKKILLPIVYLQDNALSIIGPTVIEGYPCWNCFYKRFLSTGANPFIYSFVDDNSIVNPSPVGFLFKGLLHKVFPHIILIVGNIMTSPTLGRVIFVNLIDGSFESHPVLRVPTCEHCGYKRGKGSLTISPYLY